MTNSQAIWVDEQTIAFPTSLVGGTRTAAKLREYRLGDQPLRVTDLPENVTDARVKEGYVALIIGAPRQELQEMLRGPLTITTEDVETGVQVAGALDALYGEAAKDEPVGIAWNEGVPTLRLWAPTAKDVALLIADARVPATWDERTGIWTVTGEPSWKDAEYLWEVEVYTPDSGQVETIQVTDPYSTGLTVDSKKSVLVDLADEKWMPEGWGENIPTPPSAHAIYELHVRDFSVFDQSVPEDLRGTYQAFTLDDSDGVTHLRGLADAGITSLHLLPTFDIASVPEDRAKQALPTIGDVVLDPTNEEELKKFPGFLASSPTQQAAVEEVAASDPFNWGYDPLHWGAPEGSYAVEQNGGARVREFREMVVALHRLGFQVIQDVVYNHTMESGSHVQSVLDRIVPLYYHRLDANGEVEVSTCCSNTATERVMAEKLMVDTLKRWSDDYHVDGFRFDLMGHHSLENMLAVKEALPGTYIYGEGWNFGEVANDALFTQATQGNLKGTGIGAFNDRLRDAVRGGGPTDEDHRLHQGFGSGQHTDPNTLNVAHTPEQVEQQVAALRRNESLIMLGLAGSLEDFPVPTPDGLVLGKDLNYAGQPAGFAKHPQENINYVEAHDNETLYDSNIFKLPDDADMETRIRMQTLANATVALGQSPAFFAAGTEILRSKSLDRDSYNSGDWFNGIDWSLERNTFGTGLPVSHKNRARWGQMAPLLENPRLRPKQEDMHRAHGMFLDLLRIRSTTPQLTLGDADLVKGRVTFPNAFETPGVIVMRVGGSPQEPTGDVLVVFNSTPNPWEGEVEGDFQLHPVQQDGVDEVVKAATCEAGIARVPARTVAVFIQS